MNGNAASRRYLRAVRRLLPGSRGMKNAIMARISSSVDDYLEQAPDAGVDQIADRFGDPRSVAVACLDNVDTAELLKDLHVRRRIVTAVMAVLAVILVLWSGVVAWAAIDLNRNVHGGNVITQSFSNSITYIPNIDNDLTPAGISIP